MVEFLEARFAAFFKGLVAPVYWHERARVRLFSSETREASSHLLYVSYQEECILAVELLSARGPHWSFKFLSFVGCCLLWLRQCGINVKDTGSTNLAVSRATNPGQPSTAASSNDACGRDMR